MNIQTLRKLSLKLDVSGTAVPISNTKLYVGSFGFVLMQVYVPVTQNRTPSSEPLCTVHRTVIDVAGNRKQFNYDKHNLNLVGFVTLDTGQFMIFENPMPKAFTDTEGELELVFNYSELGTNALGESVVLSRLATNIYRTTVAAGGLNNTELNLDLKSGEAAQINANTIAIESLVFDVENLLKPPDSSEANQVGVANVNITSDGNLKFSYIKGATFLPSISDEGVISWTNDGRLENPADSHLIKDGLIEIEQFKQSTQTALDEANENARNALNTAVDTNNKITQAVESSQTAVTVSNAANETATIAINKANEALENITEGIGTRILVGGMLQSSLGFESDPQTQINLKAEKLNTVTTDATQTISGKKTLTGNLIVNSLEILPVELSFLSGVTDNIQDQLNKRTNVTIAGTTQELMGFTSNPQTQLNETFARLNSLANEVARLGTKKTYEFSSLSWEGGSVPYTISINSSSHGLGSSAMVDYFNDGADDFEWRKDAGGNITIYSNTKQDFTVHLI